MVEVHLSGSIPVTVVVAYDPEDGEGSVRRVIAHDDLFEYQINDEGFQVVGPDTQGVTNKEVESAKAVAEGSIWPGWDWGW